MKDLGKARKPLDGETSLRDLSKPGKALHALTTEGAKIVPMEGVMKSARESTSVPGGALSMQELSGELDRRATFERVTTNEMEKQRFAPGEIVPSAAPDVVGVSDPDAVVGYQTVVKPYSMRCINGHLVPSGSNMFTDGTSYYCPYCGKKLNIV